MKIGLSAKILIVIVLAILILFFVLGGTAALGFYAITNPGAFSVPTSTSTAPSGNYGTTGGDLANADALTEEQIIKLLKNFGDKGKNLLPYAKQIHDSGHAFNINPLFALAIANKDSSLGTAGAGRTCRNPGNLEYRDHKFAESGTPSIGNCSTYGGSSRWAAFKTYGDGMNAKMWLLRKNYLDKGLLTLHDIINKYCPPSECDVDQYVKDVESFMNKYGNP